MERIAPTKRVKLNNYEDYSIAKIIKCNLGKVFSYRSNNWRLSLLCPYDGYYFGGFSKIYDSYDEEKKILTDTTYKW